MRAKECAQTAKPVGFTRPRPSSIQHDLKQWSVESLTLRIEQCTYKSMRANSTALDSTSTGTQHQHRHQQPVSTTRPAHSTITGTGTRPAPAPGTSTSNLSPPRAQLTAPAPAPSTQHQHRHQQPVSKARAGNSLLFEVRTP